jgi:hypothetical protein
MKFIQIMYKYLIPNTLWFHSKDQPVNTGEGNNPYLFRILYETQIFFM